MPARLKVRIIASRGLPVMDKSSDTSDAFVEVKIGNFSGKTEVCRHSLNPIWNSEYFKFEIPDEELQDECLQIKILDYDRYSADDQIGKVYLNLNPLLFKECGHQMFGYYPIYDTMNGTRGELYCTVKLEPFNDLNKFKQTSCGIRFYHSQNVPYGYYCTQILGFVEELVVNDDPEYQWIDKIRTPRASNEARQLMFYKLSNEVQRKLGNKALELGGNAVLGYQLYYDLENSVSSICARGIGTSVILKEIKKTVKPTIETKTNNPVSKKHTTSSNMQSSSNDVNVQNIVHCLNNSESVEENDTILAHPINSINNAVKNQTNLLANSTCSAQKHSPIKINPSNVTNSFRQSSSDIDLNNSPTTAKTSQLPSVGSNVCGSIDLDDLNVTNTPEYRFVTGLNLPDGLHLLEYPFITIKQFPIGLIKHIGGIVSSRSVKLISVLNSQEDSETETRDSWWIELRKEIRNHCKMLDCNAVLGYTEQTTIHDDVCILSASGTAAVLNTNSKSTCFDHQYSNYNELNINSPNNLIKNNKFFNNTDKNEMNSPNQQTQFNYNLNEQRNKSNCSLVHVPYNETIIFGASLSKCAVCKNGKVPDVLFTTIEKPINLSSIGKGCLIQARVFRNKKDTRAKEISDSLPFLEYEMHKQLLSKLKMKNMNAIFNLSVQLSIGDNSLVAVASGTGLFLAPLNEPSGIKVKGSGKGVRINRLNDIQKMITDLVERNKERYGLKNISCLINSTLNNDNQKLKVKNDNSDEPPLSPKNQSVPIKQTTSDQPCIVLEVDDGDDADIISLMIDSEVPKEFEICTTDQLPGDEPFLSIYQTFTKVFRAKITNAKQFSAQFDWIIQSLFVKLRRLTPCALAGLRFRVDASNEMDVVQISVIGSVVGIKNLNESLVRENGLYLPTTIYQDKKSQISNDGELVFDNDEEACEKIEIPATILSVSELSNRANPQSVELTTLSHLPGCKIQRYIGNLTFPFIREVTSIRESNGLNSFLTSFLNEVLFIVRSHIVSLDGNALVSMNITQLVLLHNPHKNQAQCLIIISGDVAKCIYN